VIGGGPAGIALATRAARYGIPVVLIEKARTGGGNLTHGTIPSKALIAAADHYELLRRGPALGVSGAPLQVDFGALRAHIRSVTEAAAPYVSPARLAALGVRVIEAPARFLDRRTVIAGHLTINPRRFVIAPGTIPAPPALPGIVSIDCLTPETAFNFDKKPSHLIVLGANARALELAQAYHRLGIDTTALDTRPALADHDPELAAITLDGLRAEGIRVRDQTVIAGVAKRKGGVRVTIGEADDESTIDGSHLLLAAGRQPDTADLGLENAGITVADDGIVVDGQFRTTNPRVHAIGDAIAGRADANLAEYQAECVLRNIIFRLPVRYRPADVPIVVFTDPGLARVGLDEATARQQDAGIRVLRFPFAENDRAQIERLPAGVVKVVTTKRGRVLGAGIAGYGAGEQIALWSLAIARHILIERMADFIPPYPTRVEAARRVAEASHPVGLTPPWQRRIIEFLRKFG